MLGVLLAAFLAIAPFAAYAAGSWAYATCAQEAQAQRAVLRQVPATLLQTPPQVTADPGAGYVPVGAVARWRAPDGQARTGILHPPSGVAASSAVLVWVDRIGQLTDPPLGQAQLITRAHLAEEVAVGTLTTALIAVYWLVRWALDRRRIVTELVRA